MATTPNASALAPHARGTGASPACSGVSAGVHHHDVPRDGFRPGTALPNGTTSIDKVWGFTPGFGLVLNMTPGALKSLGLGG